MSELRCRPGDLAIVVSAQYPSNLGRIVKVVRQFQGEGDLIYPASTPAWWVESSHPLSWYKKKKRYQRKKGPVPDAQLQPIRELPLAQDIADGLWDFDWSSDEEPIICRKQR